MTTRSGCLIAILLALTATTLEGSTTHVKPAMTPMGHTFFCQRYPADCERSDAKAEQPQEASAQLAQLQQVQTTVNAAIKPIDDNSGPADPNWLLWPQAGDCDDYAVTKRHELIQKGWPSADVLLTEVSLVSTGKHHLVLLVQGTEARWVLDSRKQQVMRFAELRDEYVWLRLESDDNPKLWTAAYGALPLD